MVRHSFSAAEVVRLISRVVGGNKVLAGSLGVSESLIKRQTNVGNEEERVRTDLERIEAMMVAAFEEGSVEAAYLPVHYLLEVFDGLIGKNVEQFMKFAEMDRNGHGAFRAWGKAFYRDEGDGE